MTTLLGRGAPAAPVAASTRARKLSPRVVLLIVVAGLVGLALVHQITGAVDVTSQGAIQAALESAVPIGLAGLGGLWAERAGVVNIGLEGQLILGTWFGAWGALNFGPWPGLLVGIVGGVLGGAVHALATVTFGVDHIVSGVALTLFATGLTQYLSYLVWEGKPGGGGSTQSPVVIHQLPRFSVPGVNSLAGVERHHWFLVSDVAGILRGLFVQMSVVTVLAALLVPLTWYVLWRTAFGLRIRSVGEDPGAAESVGIPVYRYKYYGVLISGGIAGLGGAFLSTVASQIFRDGQTGGRGYIGLAAMIFGNWRPGGLAIGAGLFGYTDALQLRRGSESVHALMLLIGTVFVLWAIWQLTRGRRTMAISTAVLGALSLLVYFMVDTIPTALVQAAPYVVTLVVLAFAAQRLRPPAADGKPYRRGGR